MCECVHVDAYIYFYIYNILCVVVINSYLNSSRFKVVVYSLHSNEFVPLCVDVVPLCNMLHVVDIAGTLFEVNDIRMI